MVPRHRCVLGIYRWAEGGATGEELAQTQTKTHADARSRKQTYTKRTRTQTDASIRLHVRNQRTHKNARTH